MTGTWFLLLSPVPPLFAAVRAECNVEGGRCAGTGGGPQEDGAGAHQQPVAVVGAQVQDGYLRLDDFLAASTPSCGGGNGC